MHRCSSSSPGNEAVRLLVQIIVAWLHCPLWMEGQSDGCLCVLEARCLDKEKTARSFSTTTENFLEFVVFAEILSFPLLDCKLLVICYCLSCLVCFFATNFRLILSCKNITKNFFSEPLESNLPKRRPITPEYLSVSFLQTRTLSNMTTMQLLESGN